MTTLESPAKINIGLSIVGRRQDGFHLLESLFWPLDFSDSLTIKKGERSNVSTHWAIEAPNKNYPLPDENKNTIYKALQLIDKELGLSINIEKKIPLGGGLGGGSSNAGSFLKHLVDTRVITLEKAEFIALKIGADTPFFLNPKPTWVQGIGEINCRLDIDKNLVRSLFFLLVLIPEFCDTQKIFTVFKTQGVPFSPCANNAWVGKIDSSFLLNYLKTAKNDLEPIACSFFPKIKTLLNCLKNTGALFSALSGSGSSCYAIFDTEEKLVNASKDLSETFRKLDCKGIKAVTFIN